MARIYLSPPDVGPSDRDAVVRALASGWVAPLGPEVEAFEAELALQTGRKYACALSSGTAALHLALLNAGVGTGDKVLVSTLTFVATANAVLYVGAEPVFVDSRSGSWNLDPDLVAEALADRRSRYKALITVDLYGHCADYAPIIQACHAADVLLIEDAAEALGAGYRGAPAGSFGDSAILSFNGNKIITTSGGGALVTDSEEDHERARFLATQARDPAVHYEHSRAGYNYRLSNLLAALGRSQLADLPRRITRRREHYWYYRRTLGEVPGLQFIEEPPDSTPTHWLTAILIDPDEAGTTRESVRKHLEKLDIEARPVWKPMHLQPLYAGSNIVGGTVAEKMFLQGLCLPSGSNLQDRDRERITGAILECFATGART